MSKQQLQQQKKDPLHWPWILLAVVGGVVLIAIVLVLGFIASLVYSESHQPKVGDAMNATGEYYKAIQNQDYTTAYQYLDRNAIITVHGHQVVMNSADTLATMSKSVCRKRPFRDGREPAGPP